MDNGCGRAVAVGIGVEVGTFVGLAARGEFNVEEETTVSVGGETGLFVPQEAPSMEKRINSTNKGLCLFIS